ncbi:hypothetical protein LCGC14_2699370 [marine sediment metagenome]|uniref:Uncharacterized protein n=1 Tax=marine sediment metagenome TaxID=412755 RepID=A0A0F8ZGA3_9ZZZZ
MKEFNKWYKEYNKDRQGVRVWPSSAATWKAALGFALSTRASNCRNIMSAEFLKKELKGD